LTIWEIAVIVAGRNAANEPEPDRPPPPTAAEVDDMLARHRKLIATPRKH
jgi:hypothetical protein